MRYLATKPKIYLTEQMKLFFSFIVFFTLSFAVNAQLDSQKKSVAIPAVESKKEPNEMPKIAPSQPIKNNPSFGSLNVPNLSTPMETPKKTFSLFSEDFGNPGELHQKNLDKHLSNTKLTPEEVEQRKGSLTDQYFGDFKSKAKFVNISFRDHGAVDGDLIQVRVNDDVVMGSVFLTGGFKGLKLDLKPGLNKIDFVALNQGESGPNTAEFQVVDDLGNLVSANRWNLSTGVKATIIVVKE